MKLKELDKDNVFPKRREHNKYCYGECHIRDCGCDNFNMGINELENLTLEIDRDFIFNVIHDYCNGHSSSKNCARDLIITANKWLKIGKSNEKN